MTDSFSSLTPAGASLGALSSNVTPELYQTLVDRGWRRSGTYYYKPDNRLSCCPQYTIRLEVKDFDPKKDQRKAQNRWRKYLLGQEYTDKAARYCPISREEKKHRNTTFDVCTAVKQCEYAALKRPVDKRKHKSIEPAHRLEVTLEPDDCTEEKFILYRNYQISVHKEDPDDVSESGFQRFLCNGLGQRTLTGSGKDRPIGSYHQCYRLDGKLVALGVLDLLADCVSSVYLIYHQDVSDWQFGKLSALREIAFALEHGYQYYYMGFYIHSCVKMRYKSSFRPQYVLDPISHAWDKLDKDLLHRLSARPFVSMSIERYLRLPSDKVELESYVRSIMQQPSNLLTAALNFSNVHYSTALEYVYPTRTLSDQRATAQASVQYESQHPSHSHEADQDRNGQSSDSSFDSSSTASSSSRTREAGSTQGGQFQEAQVRSQSTPRPASSPQPKYPKTVFEAGMPGALSIAEVEQQIDLAGWPTAIGEHMTTLENLVGFEAEPITAPRSIRGIAAELAACIGPDLVGRLVPVGDQNTEGGEEAEAEGEEEGGESEAKIEGLVLKLV